MKTQFDIKEILKIGEIQNELDLERALIADRKLRVLSKEDPKLKVVRDKLRDLIKAYEDKNWSPGSRIPEKRLKESDMAEAIAEKERLFIEKRKDLIRSKLKKYGLSQQEFGTILGHRNKSYISELMNGVSPFTLRDLIVINRLLKIDLTDLVPTFLPYGERAKIKATIQKLENPKLKLNNEDFVLV
ncbi:MAG: helix-turn-helix domain-containing protein [Allomuricauda sp.]